MLKQFMARDGGSTAIEYALIAGVIALAIVAGTVEVARMVGQTYDGVAEQVVQATGPGG